METTKEILESMSDAAFNDFYQWAAQRNAGLKRVILEVLRAELLEGITDADWDRGLVLVLHERTREVLARCLMEAAESDPAVSAKLASLQ